MRDKTIRQETENTDYEKEICDIKPITKNPLHITYRRNVDEMYNCQYLRHISIPTNAIGKRMVITAGFIPLKTRIENMVAAGLDLQAKREEMYPSMYDYEASLLDEYYDDDPDEITIMQKGTAAEEALNRRKRIYHHKKPGEEFGYAEEPENTKMSTKKSKKDDTSQNNEELD